MHIFIDRFREHDSHTDAPAVFDVDRYRNIVICTGAGVSVASGLPPFRGPGGVYEARPDIAEASTLDRVEEHLPMLWAGWGPMRAKVQATEPNAAHLAIAALQHRRDDVTLVTMNVDGLHQKAGSPVVHEIHGNVMWTTCMRGCGRADWHDTTSDGAVRSCPDCGGPARPAVTLFGEALPVDPQRHVKRAIRDAGLFVAVGTSDTVTTCSQMAYNARYAGARCVLVNLEAPAEAGRWDEVIVGRAEELLPLLLAGTGDDVSAGSGARGRGRRTGRR